MRVTTRPGDSGVPRWSWLDRGKVLVRKSCSLIHDFFFGFAKSSRVYGIVPGLVEEVRYGYHRCLSSKHRGVRDRPAKNDEHNHSPTQGCVDLQS